METEQAHLTEQEIDQYRQRALSPVARQRCDRHLAWCEECLGRVLDAGNSELAFARLTESFLPGDNEPFHLSDQHLKSYLSETLDEADKTICESHLESCEQCGNKVQALATIRTATPTAVRVDVKNPSFWEQPFQWWRWPIFVTPRWAGAIVVLVSLLLIWSVWHWKGASRLSEEASNNSSAPSVESRITVRLRDGTTEITLHKSGTLAGLERLAPEAQSAVKEALATADLRKPQVLADLSGPPIRLLGEAPNGTVFSLLSPLGTVVAEERPTLRWQPLKGATSYTVSVFDADFNPVARSEPLSMVEWLVPVQLVSGINYSWQVTAIRGRQQVTVPVAPAPRAQFRVLDSAELKELRKAREQKPISHLALGVLYARMGLLDDAEPEFQALVDQNPGSPVASKLLQSVESWRKR